MTMHVDPSTRNRAFALGEKVGAPIPPTIDLVFWALPILEKLASDNEELKRRIDELTKGQDSAETKP